MKGRTRNGERGGAEGLRKRPQLSAFRAPPFAAFTLVEIIVTLTIMALILGAAVPSIRGVIRERQALEPVTEFADMVRATRDRALRLQRPYQIGLDAKGCFATAFFPQYKGPLTYEDLKTELDALRQEAEVAQASAARFNAEESSLAAGTASSELPTETDDRFFLLHYEWPAGYEVSVRFWQDPQWQTLEGALCRVWVIQPSGISVPVLIRFEADGASAEARFDPLTGEIADLRSSVR